MIVTVIPCLDTTQIKISIDQVLNKTDLIELRLDYWQTIDWPALTTICNEITIPIILTLRPKRQGGFYQQDEPTRLTTLKKLAALKPTYIDIEFDVPTNFAIEIKSKHPTIQLINSFHDFEKTPKDLLTKFTNMQQPHFTYYKLATQANSIQDAVRMLTLIQQTKVIGLCMGELGQGTRLLNRLLGSPFTYVGINQSLPSAPNQLFLDEFLNFNL